MGYLMRFAVPNLWWRPRWSPVRPGAGRLTAEARVHVSFGRDLLPLSGAGAEARVHVSLGRDPNLKPDLKQSKA